MKNNRLTNEELTKLRMAADRIRELASLENASFSINEQKDKEIKNEIRPYMTWFESVAYGIDELLNDNNPDYMYFR